VCLQNPNSPWRKYDQDGDGVLNENEMAEMEKAGYDKESVNEQELFDKDRDGELDEKERAKLSNVLGR
jgi:Ca2+-binding EF-hand superfamily protein